MADLGGPPQAADVPSYGGQLSHVVKSALRSAHTTSTLSISPGRRVPFGHVLVERIPKFMFTTVITSAIVTRPSPLQSP